MAARFGGAESTSAKHWYQYRVWVTAGDDPTVIVAATLELFVPQIEKK